MARCKDETGLDAPMPATPLRWSPLEPGDERSSRGERRGRRLTATLARGLHGRAGFGRRAALVVVDVNRGFTDPESPLVCDLDGVVDAIRRLLDGFRAAGLPVAFTTVAYDEAGKQAAEVFIDKIPALLVLEAGSSWTEIDPRIAPAPTSRC